MFQSIVCQHKIANNEIQEKAAAFDIFDGIKETFLPCLILSQKSKYWLWHQQHGQKKNCEYFNVSQYLVCNARTLVKEKGILAVSEIFIFCFTMMKNIQDNYQAKGFCKCFKKCPCTKEANTMQSQRAS